MRNISTISQGKAFFELAMPCPSTINDTLPNPSIITDTVKTAYMIWIWSVYSFGDKFRIIAVSKTCLPLISGMALLDEHKWLILHLAESESLLQE
jgi:hypothetical protein